MLKLYFCSLVEEEPGLPPGLLSSYRTEKLSSLKNSLVRRQSIFSELLLRYTLRDSGFPLATPLEIVEAEQGKPYLQNESCFFSISHSENAVLCALCDSEVGADLQIRSKFKTALAERFFTPDEQTYILSSADVDAAFTEIWTKKESWCKYTGQGLGLSLSSFSVLDDQIAPSLWHMTEGEYHISVCTDKLPDQIGLNIIDASALLP